MKVAIIANGEELEKNRLEKILADIDIIIAADGGANICKKYDIVPNYIIGDLDSIENIQDFEKSVIVKKFSQDSSDMQKALVFAANFNPDLIKIISAFGKRSDHTMANMIIFAQSEFSQKLELYDNHCKIRLLKPNKYCLNFCKESIVSLFSFGKLEKLSLKGFRYNISKQDFLFGFSGLSNVAESENVEISFSSGLLFLSELV